MTIEERKLSLINWITGISEEEVLESIEALKQGNNWFEDLPVEVQEAVMRSKAQGEKGIYVDPEIQEKKIKSLF